MKSSWTCRASVGLGCSMKSSWTPLVFGSKSASLLGSLAFVVLKREEFVDMSNMSSLGLKHEEFVDTSSCWLKSASLWTSLIVVWRVQSSWTLLVCSSSTSFERRQDIA